MTQLQVRTFQTIRDIPREQWDAVWPRLAEGYDFYLCQELAGIEGFEFLYLALYAGDQLALVAPVFVAHFDMGLAMDAAGREKLKKVRRYWSRCLVLKTLFCGSPVSEKGLVGIHPEHLGKPELLKAFDAALSALARQHGTWMTVFKDFMDGDLQTLAPLKAMGWFTGDGLPTASLTIASASVDDYLETLSTGMRKDMKRKLRKTEKTGLLEIEAVTDIGHCIDDVHRLYMGVFEHGDLHWEVLTKRFFLNFTQHMPDNTVFFLYWKKNPEGAARQLVGFNFCLQFEDRLIDKYIGMDYAVSRELNLYFVSFLNNVQWCIEHGKGNYMLSQGGYEVKQQMGAQLIPLRTMTKMTNRVVNWFATRFGPS